MEEPRKHAGGRPVDPLRKLYADKYGIKLSGGSQATRFSLDFVIQLARCKDEAARRLLMGRSR